jgi:putative ABC transport system substrate-binding protein
MVVVHYEPEDDGDFRRAFADMPKSRVSGMIDLAGLAVSFPYKGPVAELALKYRIPSVFFLREIVERGGLVSFGASVTEGFRRSAHYVDRLARGAKAADLPIEQPSVFETCVNLKTARALGIRIPESILLRASRVIE